MPMLISDVLPPGSLRGRPQPTIPVEGGLVLRPWSDDDAPAVHRVFQDPGLHLWHARTCDSVAEAAGLIERWRGDWDEESAASWAVSRGAEGELVGRIALRVIQLADGQAEIGYWTVPEARGQRVAPRALAALADWSFGEFGLHRLELLHSTANEASCRVAARTGFLLEGTKRRSILHPDGWHDMHLHARVAGD
ncbi:GNAT family N-acetyltransferase [Streptomyces sp. NA04227]|uniref:GNAT family N-acetyltransferase n=1 Tax=Streptomyces sp. NA04227 TaxID=2742136 RepID=UPI001590E8AF|nr:GNAT family N-acetyltransferase [Streptomyces sp. NA04227]QKW05609.1 GNAT family N-acetyltransferase [Streptomyces sp. NA04227]